MTSQLSDSTPIVLPNLHDGNLLGLMYELLGRIGNGSLHLFQLSSSYGCTLTSLCGDVASQLVDRDTLLRQLGL